MDRSLAGDVPGMHRCPPPPPHTHHHHHHHHHPSTPLQAVAELGADCRRMEQPQKTRLALHLMNCQLAVQGSDTFPCRPRQTLRECTDVLPDRAHAMYVEYLTHADT